MNRTIKAATVKRFHYDDHDQLRNHLTNFISAYNFGRRLKTLKGLTPYEFICKKRTIDPEMFILNPSNPSNAGTEQPDVSEQMMVSGGIIILAVALGKKPTS